MIKINRFWLVLLILALATDPAQAQMVRRPVRRTENLPFIDTSWQNNPYVYWMIHHPAYPNITNPYPNFNPYSNMYPYPYPVPMGQGYTSVSNYYQPQGNGPPQRTTALLPKSPDNQAVVVINLPTTAAVVWIDGQKLESGLSATRVYTTPQLEPGSEYTYTVKAQWVRLGSNVSQEKTVQVEAGKTSVVDFKMDGGS